MTDNKHLTPRPETRREIGAEVEGFSWLGYGLIAYLLLKWL